MTCAAEHTLEHATGIHALREARWKRAAAALLILTMLSGCASTRSWTAGEVRTANHALDPGDRVVVALKSGERVETVLKAIDKRQVQTEAGDYSWADIRQLEAEKTNTVGPFILLGALAAIYLMSQLADAFEDGFSSDD